MGGEKLKISRGVFRPLSAALVLCAGLLVITISPVFAQTAPSPDVPAGEDVLPLGEDAPIDPITGTERALVLEEGGTRTAQSGPSSLGAVFRMVLTLAVAAAAVYGCVYFIKRASRRREVQDPFLKVLASAHLGSNRYAHVVSAGSKAWLLGAAEGGVNLISEIEDKDILNALFLEDSRKSAELPRLSDFKSLLRRLGMPVDKAPPPDPDAIRKRRERIKGL